MIHRVDKAGEAYPSDVASAPDGTSERSAVAPPIFVVGSMRSGSTMLRLILDSHPNIAIGSETGFMGALSAAKKIPNWKFGDEWYSRLDWTEAELDARLRDFYGAMFQRYATQQGKGRWGDKTPFHTMHIPTMAQVFPDAVFVGIVRHPGAVAASLRASFNYTFPDALSYWKATNLTMVRAAGQLGERFVLCRYEDLVADGEPVLRELMSCLGEPWSNDLLEHHRVQKQKGVPRVADGATSTRDRIDARRAVSWLESATSADHQALEGTASLAAFFGYQSADPSERELLHPSANQRRWLVDGSDLACRRAGWKDRIDFDEQPPMLLIDASPEELAERLAQVEQALARTRSRRAVRLGEALRKVQRGRSLSDARDAWSLLRGPRR